MLRRNVFRCLLCSVLAGVGAAVIVVNLPGGSERSPAGEAPPNFRPRKQKLTTNLLEVLRNGLEPWSPTVSLEEYSDIWKNAPPRLIKSIDGQLAQAGRFDDRAVHLLLTKAIIYAGEGETDRADEVLNETRARVEGNEHLARDWLFSVLYIQGVVALRRGETENCIECRGESSCIIPIAPAAVHTNPRGSRQAIKHFSQYLHQFPEDVEVRWLLNLAHMTLGEHPHQVDPRYLIALNRFFNSEFDVGPFRDIGAHVGVNRLNRGGGAIMDDFDNDGLLDLVTSTWDPSQSIAFYRNNGDGTFEERTEAAGLSKQLGGQNCVQADYNNDGYLDIFVCRGAWAPWPVRPSLLRNNGDGTFTDVTREAGLLHPVNSIAAVWGDYDNDGFLDLFVCCETSPNKLFHNQGDGTFEEVAVKAGVQGEGRVGKGAAWIDYDNDRYPDLFLSNRAGDSQLFHNNRDGTFTDVSVERGVMGPRVGFSCWAWDYDNDGWLDLFVTSYFGPMEVAIGSLENLSSSRVDTNRLYRNLGGKGFQDMTHQAGVDGVYTTMGSNFGDFDNDGYLDFYLGTGAPALTALVPNRLFKNVGGKRFADVTASSRTGNLQKGHGVAFGDWTRDGHIDIFIQMGGAVAGDRYHNILFRNPGHGNNWLTVKLVGKKTNRSALGARLKVVTAGAKPLTVHRHVSSGSSFGANPLQQTIGLGKARRVAVLEVHWPTSGTTQVFRDIAVDQAIEITEFAADYRMLDWKPIALPKGAYPNSAAEKQPQG